MEQTILDNSKGATYMSFVLDIEIVIKNDGDKVNLAEKKAKNNAANSKKQPDPGQKNQNMNVYAMAMNHPTVFSYPVTQPNNDNLSTRNKQRETDDTDSQVKEVVDNKCDKVYLKQDASNAEYNSLKKKLIAKKKTKREKKVFKGKIEPIDFLECNRIFMCNYLYQKHLFKAKANPINETTDEKENLTPLDGFSIDDTKDLCSRPAKTLIRKKRLKFWKPSGSKINNTIPKNNGIFEETNSSGDQILQNQIENNCCVSDDSNKDNSSVKACEILDDTLLKKITEDNILDDKEIPIKVSCNFKQELKKKIFRKHFNIKSKSVPYLETDKRKNILFDFKSWRSRSNKSVEKELKLSDLKLMFFNGTNKELVHKVNIINGTQNCSENLVSIRADINASNLNFEQAEPIKEQSKNNEEHKISETKPTVPKSFSDFQIRNRIKSNRRFWKRIPTFKKHTKVN